MHERLAAEDTEIAVAGALGLADQTIEPFGVDHLARPVDLHPAALAAEIAAVDNRNVQERRKMLAALQPPLEPLHGPDALEAEVVGKPPQDAGVGLGGEPQRERGKRWKHRGHSSRSAAASALASRV
jgi:hypothetical protein